MAIVLLSCWTTKQNDVERIGRKAKALFQKNGAEFEVNRIFSGTNAGQFMTSIRFVDWERFGRAMYALSRDAEFQDAVAEANRVGELRERNIVVTIDLGADCTASSVS
jgi:hypothetical protein